MSTQLPLQVRFLKRYARHLHAAGVPANHFERMMTSLADNLDFNCQVLSSPTAVFMSFQYQDDDEDHRPIPIQLVRLSPPSINLGNTLELYRLGVAAGGLEFGVLLTFRLVISLVGGLLFGNVLVPPRRGH